MGSENEQMGRMSTAEVHRRKYFLVCNYRGMKMLRMGVFMHAA